MLPLGISTRTVTVHPLSTTTIHPVAPSPTPSSSSTRYCPWCNPSTVPPAEDASSCKLVAQVPETFNTVVAYPVLVFNHDLTKLVHVEMVTPYVQEYLWMGAEVGVNVTFRGPGVERTGEA